jgi:hypothetical protein
MQRYWLLKQIVGIFTIVLRSQPFKAEWQLYVPPALPASNCAFCIYVSCMNLDVNSDYFLKQR